MAQDDGPLGLVDTGQRPAPGLEVGDHRSVGLEDLLAGIVRDLRGEPTLGVDRHDGRDPGGAADGHVILAEGGREVDEAGAVLRGDEVAEQHLVRVLVLHEVVERRRVAQAGELPTGHPRDLLRLLTELLGVRGEPRGGEQHPLARERGALGGHHRHVLDVRPDGEREVRRERPRGRRPEQGEVARLQPHTDRQRRVLA